MAISEQTTTATGANIAVTLNGRENVILRFRDFDAADDSEALVWGFVTIAEWRSFLKALVRFDEALGVRP